MVEVSILALIGTVAGSFGTGFGLGLTAGMFIGKVK